MKHLLACALLFGLIASLGACGVTDECGPFKNKFKTTGFTSEAYKFEPGDSLSARPDLLPINDDTLLYSDFSIQMRPHKEGYFSSYERGSSFSFVPSAYACSPPIPSTDEAIKDMQIYSDKDFNSEYAAGDDLAGLFDILVLNQARDFYYRRFDLNTFLSTAPNATDEIILVLKTAPQTTSGFQFTVKYYQEGRGLHRYEFETKPVALRPR